MNTTYEQALAALNAAAAQTGEHSVHALEAAIADVAPFQDPRSIGVMLLMLDDDAPYDEGMFSLIHAAEAFDDAVYAPAFVDTLPQIFAKAPRWASITLMRALNGDATRVVLARALGDAPPEARRVAKRLCETINKRHPHVAEKTLPVLAACEGA